MNRRAHPIAVAAFLVFCTACAPQPYQMYPVSAQTALAISVLEKVLDFGDGISMTVNRIEHDAILQHAKIFGTIHNKTGKTWEQLRLPVALDTTAGFKNETLVLFDVKPGDQSITRSGREPGYELSLWARNVSALAAISLRSLEPNGKYTGAYRLRYGISLIKPEYRQDLFIEDSDVHLAVTFEASGFGLRIRNKTNEAITLDWNTTSYVDTSGTAQRVFHEGVKFTDRNQPHPPSLIPPGATLRDTAIPTYLARWSDVTKGWVTDRLLPPGPEGERMKGMEFGLFLPLTVNGKAKPYNLRFRIDAVDFK